MVKSCIITNEEEWKNWIYNQWPEDWMVIRNEPEKYPCLVKEVEQYLDGEILDVYISITYLEEAEHLISHYWANKRNNHYPDSEGFELQNDCNN